jgi:alpha-tubulin suppressor-like RCC1 family protein
VEHSPSSGHCSWILKLPVVALALVLLLAQGQVMTPGSYAAATSPALTSTPPSEASIASVLAKAVQVSTGDRHACAVTAEGGVKCWGGNGYGQLGDGTTTDRLTPVDVQGLGTKVVALSSGSSKTCAVTSSGGVKCWGCNQAGQLGDGTTTNRLTPVDVAGLTSGVVSVTAGNDHACAVTTSGGVKCWGGNQEGDLGDGTAMERHTPVEVAGLTSGVRAVTAFGYFTCALTTGGGVKCWGSNYGGQLGDGSTTDRSMPVDVVGLSSGVVAVSAGGLHTCAVTAAGGVKCWGWNGDGQDGDGTTTDRLAPVDVAGLASGVQGVSSGGSHTCALISGGGVKCWGSNESGRLGDGTTTQRLTPVDVSGLDRGVAQVSAG